MAEWRDQRLLPLEQLCQWPLLGARVSFTDGARAGNGVRGDPLELSVSSELALSELSELCGSFHVALRVPSLLQGPTFPRAVAPGRTVPARAAQVSPESSSLPGAVTRAAGVSRCRPFSPARDSALDACAALSGV